MKLLSISVQAHVRRKDFFPYLKEKLGDIPFAVDDGSLKVWGNRKAALALAPTDSKYHLVVQDDAVLCEDFLKKANEFINRMDKIYPDENLAFQLYHGYRPQHDLKSEMFPARDKGYIRRRFLSWGVAIVIPTRLIPDLIAFGNGYPAWQDDTKIKHWLAHRGMPTIWPIPCLVDHRQNHETPSLVPGRNLNRFSPYFIDAETFGEPTEAHIPKIVHQIWVGDQSKRPQLCMDTWKMKGWRYMLWTEAEIDELGLKNRELYDHYYKKKIWHGCSDVARIEILHKLGGIYIDSDTERLAPIDELLNFDWHSTRGTFNEIQYRDFFAVWSNRDDRVANGVIASLKGHPILTHYIEEMGRAERVEPAWNTIGGTLFTKMIDLYKTPRTQLLKPISFYPFDSKGVPARGRGTTYARHFWKADTLTSGKHKFYKVKR